jgi:GT2 family glycosyltransferase
MRESITFVVPTLRRNEHLCRCLNAIGEQTHAAHEVLVGIRADDQESRAVVQEFADHLPVKEVEAVGVGVVGSMTSCVAAATGEFIGLLDDDVSAARTALNEP